MSTLVENLIPLFADPEASSDHDALCQHIREYVNADATGDIDLSDEIEIGRDKFNDLYNDGDYSPSHAPDMRMLSSIVKALSTVKSEQEEARAALDEEFSAAAAEMSNAAPTTEASTETAEAAAEGTDAGPQDEGETPDASQEGNADTVSAAGNEPSFKVKPAAAPVRLPSASAVNAQRPASSVGDNARLKYSVIAAAEVPRTTSGSALSMKELADATIRRFQVMPIGQKGIGARRGSIALIKRTFDRSLQTYNDRRDQQTIDRIADERNLPGGNLVAAARSQRQALTAAGCCTSMSNDIWCAPSETDYTLCPPLSTLEGMVDLPTIPINRGGIRYPVWNQNPEDWHGQIVNNTCDDPIPEDHFTQAGNEKVCIEGPCPTWEEKRLNIAYLCVVGDLLRETGFPELTQRFIEDTMVQHAHYMNHRYLMDIFEGSDMLPAFDVSNDGLGSVSDSIIDRLGLLIAWFRERYKLGMSETLEGIAPAWFREYIKLDLARKNNRPYSSVTDAEVDELFAAYTARVQWVYDTEGIGENASLGNGDPVGGRIMPGQWPNNVEMVFFPAGSWVLGQQDVITLDAFYDSTMLKQNKYTALFTEEGFLLLNRCNRSFRVRLTNLCRNGGVTELATLSCPENPPPEPATQTATLTASSTSGATTEDDSGSDASRRGQRRTSGGSS